ncbi:hypothetical protein [Xanthocytophaga flava]|uniref:hypothetical protein n=1 Tax=Xanthocytophaga flava TaxID=3048013 RepID=UPI0028D71F4C|nr:hypothetical protein [Xanthocytophaga flavus]MDJ1468169.1 hypothetical protein [Xanthocytophaga flavus]
MIEFISMLIYLLAVGAVFGCVSLGGIQEECGPNPGGQNELYIIAKRDLESIPDADEATHTISEDIVPKTGKGFVKWDFALDTGELTSETTGDQGNQACKVGVGVYVPRSNPKVDKVINQSYNTEFVVIGVDALGQKKIAGNLSRGLMFTSKYTSGKKFEDKNGREVGFAGGQPNEPYFYTGVIPLAAPAAG